MEKEYKISWGKIVGITALIAIIIILIVVLYPNKKDKEISSTYINNINLLKSAGFEYFQGERLPNNIGESSKISLEDMVERNLIIDFTDEKNNTCNKEESYVKVTKTLDNEYSMKIFLDCKSNADYIITTITNNECVNCDNKSDITIRPNDSDNSNNSSSNNSNPVNNNTSKPSNNSSSNNNITNNTTYNINYVNNCGNCSGDTCNCIGNVYYTVNFDSNGGTPVDSIPVKAGDTVSYRSTSRIGYEFLGWYLNGEKYDFNTPVTKRITLTAKWRKIQSDKEEYDVCFVTNGGTNISCQTILEGNKANKPSNPTKSCYDFAGWYTTSSLNYKYDFNSKVYSDIILYAKWVDNGTCRNKYTVRFNSNGGTIKDSQTVYEGERAYKPTNPVKNGYNFIGWYTDTNYRYLYNFNNSVYNDITLYAKWEKIEYNEPHTVRFNSNGGTSVITQYIEDGNRAYEPTTSRSGYRFLGWYYNNSPFDFTKRIYRDYTLVARWEKIEEYSTYCKIVNARHLSTTYVSANKQTWNYNWTIRFDNINSDDLKITSVNYITNPSIFNNDLNSYKNGLSMVGGNNNTNYSVPVSYDFINASLKPSNFNKFLSTPYKKNGYWYTDATVNIKNYNNVSSYYAPNLKYNIYPVAFYFDIKYTDKNNCFTDKASNAYKYSNYKVVSTYSK